MSSTNRGGQRQPDDFYTTPAWAVEAVLPHLHLPLTKSILEPGAGEGPIVRALIGAGVSPEIIHAVELDRERAAACMRTGCVVYEGDFLDRPVPWPRFHLAVGNPPFSLALEFIEHALLHADRVAMLLRLNFLGSQKRAPWHRAHPSDVRVLPRRPSFTPDGKTDSCEYAWFLWPAGPLGGQWSILYDPRGS